MELICGYLRLRFLLEIMSVNRVESTRWPGGLWRVVLMALAAVQLPARQAVGVHLSLVPDHGQLGTHTVSRGTAPTNPIEVIMKPGVRRRERHA